MTSKIFYKSKYESKLLIVYKGFIAVYISYAKIKYR